MRREFDWQHHFEVASHYDLRRSMNKKTSLEYYALFYEKLDTGGTINQSSDLDEDTSYEKKPCLSDEQIKALQEDLQKPLETGDSQSE